jgi:uncharacterized protein YjiS (DUF1127 family)
MADISLHFSSHAPLAGTFTALSKIFNEWRERARARDELAKLDERSLRDLGLSWSSAEFEVNKPFWRG